MAATTGERTLISSLLPPGTTHVDGCFSAGKSDRHPTAIALVAAFASSMLSDFSIRAVPKKHIRAPQFERLAFAADFCFHRPLLVRILRLTCLTAAYADLWESVYDSAFRSDDWTFEGYATQFRLGQVERVWNPATPLRRGLDRRQALVEIDALVALAVGVTADELTTIYRTHFPVLAGYDRSQYIFDANGRLVPKRILSEWRRRQGNYGEFALDELTQAHPGSNVPYEYQLPFRSLDREADLRAAYSEFERRFASRSDIDA